ncbi:MAG: putative protein with an alpha/beta hydrolase fold protein [Candidatus Accumulibacter adjunctus]|uniref:AB hydrolase-1 domain-containing protein n=1 Tax=Candidatus Accumulibacter adjunctus TaxID=1454001 RepID=A0A011MSM7_9PROT|nr:MAG: putative protein with an alpha/beta hydrolase fold protein [Candidatus Accumulibacter adjunctus]
MRNGSLWNRLFTAGVLAAMILVLGSCNLVALHRDLTASVTAGGVAGKVFHDESDASAIVVVGLREDGGTWIAENYVHLATRHDFLMRLVAGKSYVILAFADRNDNLRLDDDEPAVVLPNFLTVARGWKGIAKINLTLAQTARVDHAIAGAVQGLAQIARQPLPVWVGEVTDLDDERLSAESGRMGLWQPFEFLTNVGIGIFMLEPYDPKRVPVLFVSGAGGNPWEWRALIEALDHSRYQPWVFVYPSGQRLANSVAVMERCATAMQREYGFDRLYVTAHSMGGLLARDFIQRYTDPVPVFVSLVTPWRGHRAAAMGVARSPAVVPSWVDMQTDSEFQQAIFARPLPVATMHYLLYAQTDPTQPFERATDGTIALSSQLHADAVREAKEVFGFTGTHTSILNSPVVIAAYLRILQMPAAGQ